MTDADGIAFFIPTYPDLQTDPEFGYSVARKKEFYDLRLQRSEPVPDEAGDLLLSQVFMKRFFSPDTPYDKIMVAHGIGTGKSCVLSAIIENFKNTMVDGKPRKRALVFVKSEELARNIIQEVSKVCTSGGIYLAKPTEAEIRKGVDLSREAIVARENRAIAKTYEIIPVETFLRKMPSDDVIKKLYSDRVIIVDEAHTFRLQPTRKKKNKGFRTVIQDEVELEENVEFGVKGVDTVMLYKQMHHFLHTVERCRTLLLTGTPIWDKASEIGSLMNLILPETEQLPTGKDFDAQFFDDEDNLREDTVDELKAALRGRVSFLRPMMTTATKIERGTKSPWLKYVTIFPDMMSETQAIYAKEAREAVETKTIKVKGKVVEREVKGGTVLKTARDAMNMVLPIFDADGQVIDIEYGPAAFKKHIVKQIKRRTKKGNSVTIQTYAIENKFLRNAIKTNLAEYACKFASIIEDVKAHPNMVTFIYNEEVTGLGGSIMLGLCLEIHGFRWIKTANDIAAVSQTRRFAVITSDPQTTNQPSQIQELLASVNRPDNKYADRLQIIIGSEKIALGLTIKNVRRYHSVMPHWNMPSDEQAGGRGLRFGSHDALPEAERVIHTCRHVAVESADNQGDEEELTENSGETDLATGKGFPATASFSPVETTDIYIYRIAEQKEHKNTQIYRLIKQADPGCAIFYNRNVLPEDQPGTRECDYQECNYECDGFPQVKKFKQPEPADGESPKGTRVWDYSIPEDQLDYSTYNLFYSSERVKKIMANIVELFNNYFSLLIDTAQQLLSLPQSEKQLLLAAIDILINSRVVIRNRYGFGSYLKESGGMLFLDDNILSVSNFPESTYIEMPLVTEVSSLDSLVEIIELETDKERVQEFCAITDDPETMGEIWEKLSYHTKIVLLEASYQTLQNEDQELPASAQYVIDDLGSNIYGMSDDTPVHTLYNEEFKGVAYDVAAKDMRATGKMRMFVTDPTQSRNSGWITVPSLELEKEYIEEIKGQLASYKEETFEDNPYGAYGWISKKDGSFRINLKQEPGKKGKIRGRKCVNFQVPDLVDIFVERLEYFPEPNPDYLEYTKEELIKAIKGRSGFSKYKKGLTKKDGEYLMGLLTIMTMRIEELCVALQSFFEEHELLYSM